MTTMATEDLDGAFLNWAVAKALGAEFYLNGIGAVHAKVEGRFIGGFVTKTATGVAMPHGVFVPCRNWCLAGPIIERERIELRTSGPDHWYADKVFPAGAGVDDWCGYGPTPLIAAMRAFVGARLGEMVEIPASIAQ